MVRLSVALSVEPLTAEHEVVGSIKNTQGFYKITKYKNTVVSPVSIFLLNMSTH